MAEQPQDIEVDLNDLKIAGGTPEVEVVSEPEAGAKPPVSAEDGIAEFKAKLERSERERDELARRAQEAENRLASGQRENADRQLQTIDGQINQLQSAREAANNKLELLEREIAQAYAAGDFAAVAKHQREMARQQTYVTRFEEGLVNLDQVKRQPRPQVQERQQAAVRQTPANPVDAWIGELSPTSQDWARRNRDAVADPRLRSKMVAGHHDALAEGIAVDTPEYFSHVEKFMGVKQAAEQTEGSTSRRQQVAAPPSRQAPANTRGPTKVTLSAEEKQTAIELGMTPEQYAVGKLRVTRDGKYNHH